MASFTGDLVDHSSPPLLRDVGLDLYQGLSEGPRWLEDCLDPKGSTYPLQLLAASLNIGQTHGPQWVFICGFGGRGIEMGSTGECLLY